MPTIHAKVITARDYLKQYQDWQFIVHRWSLAELQGNSKLEPQQKEHVRAVHECQHREQIISTIKQDNAIGAWILFYRFLKRRRVKRTIELLAGERNIHISERELYRQQRQALLEAYDIITSSQVSVQNLAQLHR